MYRIYRKIHNLFSKAQNPNLSSSEKILLVRWDGKIGDSVVSSPLVKNLAEDDNKELFIITTKGLRDYYIKYFNIPEQHVIEITDNQSILEIYKICKKLPCIDTVIHLVELLRFNDLLLLKMLRPQNVLSLDDRMNCVNIKLKELTKNMNFHEKYQFISLSLFGYLDNDYVIPQSNKNILSYDILYNPFASKFYRTINVEKSISLLEELTQAFPNKTVGILNSPETKDIAVVIQQKISNPAVSVVEEITNFYDAISAVVRANLVISVDTSIVHIAYGLNKKLIAICPYNINTYNHWLPRENCHTKVVKVPRQTISYLSDFSNHIVKQYVKNIE